MLGISTQEFFIKLLEMGGLPALTLGILFTIFFFWMRSQAQANEAERQSNKQAFEALQNEREIVREREYKRDAELMRSYEELTDKFVDISTETAKALARLSERVGACPFRDSRAHMITENEHD